MFYRHLLALAAFSVASLTGAAAQDFPARPMTMIIPFAAGGPQDTLGRIVAQRMSEVLGQQVIVENVGGGGGMTGSLRVAQAPPDGYLFVLGSVGTHAQNQTLYKKPLYNTRSRSTTPRPISPPWASSRRRRSRSSCARTCRCRTSRSSS